MIQSVIEHEHSHILGGSYGLYKVIGKQGFDHFFYSSKLVLDLSPSAGLAFINDSLTPLQLRAIHAVCALTPAIVRDPQAFKLAMHRRSVTPLIESDELSESDRYAFSLHPIEFHDVMGAGLVAQEYLRTFGTRFYRFAQNLKKAAKYHDTFELAALVNMNRFKKALHELPALRETFYATYHRTAPYYRRTCGA